MALKHFDTYTHALLHTLPPPVKDDPFEAACITPAEGAESIVMAYFNDVHNVIVQASRYEIYVTKCAQGCYGYVAAYFDNGGNLVGCYSQPMWCFEE